MSHVKLTSSPGVQVKQDLRTVIKTLSRYCQVRKVKHQKLQLTPTMVISSVQSIPTLCKINAAKWLRCNLVLYGSFFQHGNNSGKRDTVAFHGACIECNMNVDAMGMSIATLKCLAFHTYMTLYV